MIDTYRIYGSEMSPYSVKVRSYFRYKSIPHQWILRGPHNQDEFQKYARLPLVPLVVTPEDEGIQDSTPIIERLEERFGEPSIHPADPTLAFLSALLEEFGDEWGNKWMFHLRWAREVDQKSSAGRIAAGMAQGTDEAQRTQIAEQIRERMVGRVWFVGSSLATAPQIEETFADAIAALEPHFETRPYLFGDRPAFADFGLWAQLYCAWTDPTGGAMIEGRAPQTLAWIQRMLWPKVEDNGPSQGAFEDWRTLEPTLAPFISRFVSGLFLPWSVANAQALEAGDARFTVELEGSPFTQKPQKYHARSLSALSSRYEAIADKSTLEPLLDSLGALAYLG